MVELIKLLVEAITNTLPSIAVIRHKKRSTELGVELFLLYVRLNEVTMMAEKIIKKLGVYAYDERRIQPGQPFVNAVEIQAVNVARVADLLSDAREVLQIMDVDNYRRIDNLLEWKTGALQVLLGLLRSGRLPLPSHEELEEATSPALESQSGEMMLLVDGELAPRWRDSALPTEEVWGPEVRARAASYLQERKPREQLDEIRAALNVMRTVLEQHFSLSDVLFKVGDDKLDIPSFRMPYGRLPPSM